MVNTLNDVMSWYRPQGAPNRAFGTGQMDVPWEQSRPYQQFGQAAQDAYTARQGPGSDYWNQHNNDTLYHGIPGSSWVQNQYDTTIRNMQEMYGGMQSYWNNNYDPNYRSPVQQQQAQQRAQGNIGVQQRLDSYRAANQGPHGYAMAANRMGNGNGPMSRQPQYNGPVPTPAPNTAPNIPTGVGLGNLFPSSAGRNGLSMGQDNGRNGFGPVRY